jgi:hypothetical protein
MLIRLRPPDPNENSVQPMAEDIPQANREAQAVSQTCLSLVNEIRG